MYRASSLDNKTFEVYGLLDLDNTAGTRAKVGALFYLLFILTFYASFFIITIYLLTF